MKLLKGLFKDCEPIDQPAQTYREAFNILLDKSKGAVVSEEGTLLIDSLPSGHEIIGHISLQNDEAVVFTTDGTDSIIGRFNVESEIFAPLLNSSILNFNSSLRVEGTYKVNSDGDRIIYWTDDFNPPRKLNIDTVPTISSEKDLSLFLTIDSAPVIELNEVSPVGGSLKSGSYIFSVAYVNDEHTETNYITSTNTISVNSKIPDTTGEVQGTPTTGTGKAISLDITNLDQSFNSVRIAFAHYEGATLEEVGRIQDIPITSETLSYTFTGNETIIPASLDDININNVFYSKAKTLTQQDKKLYLGNLEKPNTINYQKYANNIKVKCVSKEVGDSVNGTTGRIEGKGKWTAGNETLAYYNKNFRRDEVYAFYISLLLKDGSETPAFHIPGREALSGEKDQVSTGSSNPNDAAIATIDSTAKHFHVFSTPDPLYNMGYWENQDEVYPTTDSWKKVNLTYSGGSEVETEVEDLRGEPVRHHKFPSSVYEPLVGDTSYSAGKNNSIRVLGIQLQDVKFPEEIADQIKGFKIYYAKKDSNNSLVIGQGYAGSPKILNGDDEYVTDIPNTSSSDVTKSSFVNIHSFDLLRTKNSIGQAQYIKNVANCEITANYDSSEGDHKYAKWLSEQEPLSDITDTNYINIVDNIAYMPANVDKVTLTNLGFDYNASTTEEEEHIFAELKSSPGEGWLGSAGTYFGFIANLMSIKKNVFNSFDTQELVYAGITVTDLEDYTPASGTATTGSTASGSVTPDDAPTGSATCSIEVTGTPDAGQSGTVTITYDGDAPSSVDVLVDEFQTLTDIADAIVLAVNDVGSTIDITADNTGAVVTFTAKTPGTSENAKNVQVDGTGITGLEFDLSSNNETVTMVGGQTGLEGTFIVTFGNGLSASYNVQYADTASDIATGLASDLNSGSTADYFTATPSALLDIVFDTVGTAGNMSITLSGTSASVSGSSKVNMQGGVDPSNYTDVSYRGDTYITAFGSRFTEPGATDDVLIAFNIVESRDNIIFRQTGENETEFNPNLETLSVLDANLLQEVEYTNFYGYDEAHSIQGILRVTIPYRKNFTEVTNFPNRIARSIAQEERDISDNFRIFLDQDNFDLGKERGELVKLSIYDNIIIPHMEKGLFRTKGKEHLITGDVRAFIGSGDIFEVAPDEISWTELGYGGLTDPKTAITTPYGYFFVDTSQRKVFLVTDKLEAISDKGMSSYFRDSLDNTGDGQLIAVWDSKWDRIILTNIGNWTVSYYPAIQAWVSFHSYTPDYYIPLSDNFASVDSETFYTHGRKRDPATFYGTTYSSSLEYVENRMPEVSKTFVSLQHIAEVKDEATDTFKRLETFDSIQIYNNYQDSGEITLVPQTSYMDGNIRNVEGTWTFNQFRDIIDPDTGLVDDTRTWQEQNKFIGKFIVIKLTFNNTSEKSVYLYSVNTLVRKSHR